MQRDEFDAPLVSPARFRRLYSNPSAKFAAVRTSAIRLSDNVAINPRTRGTNGSHLDASVGPHLLSGPQIELATAHQLAAVPVGVAPLQLLNVQAFQRVCERTTGKCRAGESQTPGCSVDSSSSHEFRVEIDLFQHDRQDGAAPEREHPAEQAHSHGGHLEPDG